jgi:hypothetical protein
MYHTTGFTRDEILEICIIINSLELDAGTSKWPPRLGLFKSAVATLTYMRHNRTQAEIGESLGVSQPTISRAVSAITPLLARALSGFVPVAEELSDGAYYIVDGTLLPCWTWRAHPELKSGKHKASGLKVILACTLAGRLAWISDPVTGNHHDMYCLKESGLLDETESSVFSGDTGFIGAGMITPIRKPKHRELLPWEKKFNTDVARFRWVIEQVISHFKNWTIMHTDYRRPLKTFETTISAVTALHFYRAA